MDSFPRACERLVYLMRPLAFRGKDPASGNYPFGNSLILTFVGITIVSIEAVEDLCHNLVKL